MIKYILGILSLILIVVGAIKSYFSFEVGTGIMSLGIFIAALMVFIEDERKDKKIKY